MTAMLFLVKAIRRVASFVVSSAFLATACGGPPTDTGGLLDPGRIIPAAFNAESLRSLDVPSAGEYLRSDEFWGQVAANDPLFGRRCQTAGHALLAEASDAVGGIQWRHDVRQLIDESQPPLHDGKFPEEAPAWLSREDADVSAASAGEGAVSIERPDLVGYRNGVAVFLSAEHGLLAVDVTGTAPQVSCALQLPGKPLNFYARGNQFVLNINGAGTAKNRGSGLLYFEFDGEKFELIDAEIFAYETILDSRSFSDDVGQALAIYTVVYQPAEESPSESDTRARAVEPHSPEPRPIPTTTRRLHVLNWNTSLAPVFVDELHNDDMGALEASVVERQGEWQEGDHVYSVQSYLGFLSASDRYLVVSQRGTDRFVDRIVTYTARRCTYWNSHWRQRTLCWPDYEQRPNPDYVPPSPSGDYDCDGKSLADCIVEAAPLVSQYIYVRVGETCDTYWQGRCEAHERYEASYPQYRDQKKTRYTIYRFANGAFNRLDTTAYDLQDATGDTASVSFTPSPFVVDGHIGQRDQIQFQNGYLYIYASGDLHTFRLEGNTAVRTHRLTPDPNAWSTSYGQRTALVRFAGDRALISKNRHGYCYDHHDLTDIISINLEQPYRPTVTNSFTMPGCNSQLLATRDGFLAPGTVSIPMGGDRTRDLQKLTLHGRNDGAELDNLLLGVEFSSLGVTQMSFNDDQAVRLHWPTQRLFTPFRGYHHVGHRPAFLLSISAASDADLTSMGTLNLPESILRTVNIADDKALAFGNSSVHLLSLGRPGEPGLWQHEPIEEIFVTESAYRFNADGAYARVDRFSHQCRISTVLDRAGLFGTEIISTAEIECIGGARAIGDAIVFTGSHTGVAWAADGTGMRSLAQEEIDALLALAKHDVYCTTDPKNVAEWYPRRVMVIEPDQVGEIACFAFPEWTADHYWR